MRKQTLVLEKYPQIIDYQKIGFSYNDMISMLFANSNITINDLKSVLPRIKKNMIFDRFNKIILLHITLSKYHEFSIMEPGFYVTLKNAPHDTKDRVTEESLTKIANPIARVRAKWLTRCFHIPNSVLLNDSKLSDKEKFEISQLHNNIEQYYDDLFARVKQKYAKYIFTNHNLLSFPKIEI